MSVEREGGRASEQSGAKPGSVPGSAKLSTHRYWIGVLSRDTEGHTDP